MKVIKLLKPSIKNLAVKRVGKIRNLVKMLGRVKGLDLSSINSSLDNIRQQLEDLSSSVPTPSNHDLI